MLVALALLAAVVSGELRHVSVQEVGTTQDWLFVVTGGWAFPVLSFSNKWLFLMMN